MSPATIAQWAQQITQAHASRFTGFAPQPVPDKSTLQMAAPAALAALTACSQMGFIADDAICLANAWQQQTLRTGGFNPLAWPSYLPDFEVADCHSTKTFTSGLPRSCEVPFAPCPSSLGLYAVLPDAHWVRRMAQAGVPTVQLRFKSNDPAAIQQEVDAAVRAVEGTPARLFINDHWQAALAAQAYGVHVGQEDLDALPDNALAQLHSSDTRLGVSTHGYAEMMRAHQVRPSYIALGAVFPTTLKKMRTAPQGLGRLHAYVQLMHSYPLVAIGGIDLTQLPAVLATGVGSIAAVRALMQTDDIQNTVNQWMQVIQQHLAQHQQQGATTN